MSEESDADGIRWGSSKARWVLLVTVLGSGLASLDATVVNVALPAIGTSLNSRVAGLQWIVSGYALTLSSFILIGGALGDRFGRRRIFLFGVLWFAVASLACGFAPTLPWLVVARAFQGIGGALLTPGSLAIIQSSFVPRDRSRAVGAWSGLSGVAVAIGPFVGGWIVAAASWRYVFLVNLPLAAIVVMAGLRHLPETRAKDSASGLDIAGTALTVVGLAALTWSLIAIGDRGADRVTSAAAAAGVCALAAFVIVERREHHPMLPLAIFHSRQFTAANVVTFAVYAALGLFSFLLVVNLQQVLGYSPVQAGLAIVPVTVLMLTLSARSGQLADRVGPRAQMTVGPLVISIGFLLLSRVRQGTSYPEGVLPGLIVFGLGLASTVAPLTATVLAAAATRYAGIASGVNNAVARAASLLAVAVIPGLAGLTGNSYRDPAAFSIGFHRSMLAGAVLTAAGGVLAWMLIRNPHRRKRDEAPASQR